MYQAGELESYRTSVKCYTTESEYIGFGRGYMARIREFTERFPYIDLLRTQEGTQAWSKATTQQGGVTVNYGISCNVRHNITREDS